MIVELPVGRSRYKITCAEGEEKKLLSLAARINKRVNDLSLTFRNADEKTLLLIAALDMQEALENSIADDEEEKLNQQDLYEAVSDNMDNIAEYIEKLITKIQNY